jgi:hypothetical protein
MTVLREAAQHYSETLSEKTLFDLYSELDQVQRQATEFGATTRTITDASAKLLGINYRIADMERKHEPSPEE